MDAPTQKSIPTILDMLKNVDFDMNFGPNTKQIQVGKMYQVLTGDLGMDITVGDLKGLNKYLLSK